MQTSQRLYRSVIRNPKVGSMQPPSPSPSPSPTRSARVVLITGASSGIGRATARLLATRGEHLVLLARSETPLQDTAQECLTVGAASVQVVPADIQDADALEAAVEATVDQHGRIDVMIHSAGVVAYGDFVDVPAAVFNQVVTTNVLGAANVARSALSVMRRQRQGLLVVVGSVIGDIAVPKMSAYVVSKWALRALTRELQLENRDLPDVHITLVAPGSVDTPIYLQAANYAGHVGRPPPPVISPERVADKVVQSLDRPRRRVDVGAANVFMRLGFNAAPRLFDALVGPLFAVAGLDRERVDPHEGNVLTPRPSLNRLHGDQGSSVRAVLSGVRSKLTR